jgi:hypothetical protein
MGTFLISVFLFDAFSGRIDKDYMVERFSVQCSGLKKAKRLVSKKSILHLVRQPFHSVGMAGIANFD